MQLLSSWRALGQNVQLNIVFSAISSLASSLTSGTFLSVYIFTLSSSAGSGADATANTDGNLDVGFISATAGLTQVALALPVGWLLDRKGVKRSSALWWSGIAGLASAGVLVAALLLDSLPLLYAAAGANGIFQALNNPALAALFADSLPTGNRTWIFSLQFAVSLGASAVGPLIAVVFFATLGDTWRISELRAVMLAGNAVAAAACLLLFFFEDRKALGDEAEGVLAGEGSAAEGGSAEGVGGGSAEGAEAPLLAAGAEGEAAAASSDANTSGAGEGLSKTRNLGHQKLSLGCCTLRVRHIPWLIFASDMSIATGAGATVAFFPLFFASEEALSPIAVSSMYAAAPLLIALLATGSFRITRLLGRAWTAVMFDALGTACLFLLAVRAIPVPALAAIYVVRTAAMNASYPTQRAILMDVVPKSRRGFFNSLESLTSFTWTGSAAFGGWLVDKTDYRFTFVITGSLYVVATLILLTLVPLTRGERVDEEGDELKATAGEAEQPRAGGASSPSESLAHPDAEPPSAPSHASASDAASGEVAVLLRIDPDS